MVKGGEHFYVPLLFGLYSFKAYKGHKIPENQFHSSILISVAIFKRAPLINADRAIPCDSMFKQNITPAILADNVDAQEVSPSMQDAANAP